MSKASQPNPQSSPSGVNFHAGEELIVPLDSLFANEYNPNRMASVEMELLDECIRKFGFLFPIICVWCEELKKYRIVDGFHRYESLRRINASHAKILPLTLSYHDAVQLTVLMNRIKGMHQVERMSDLIKKLSDLGLEDEEIQKNLGMEVEEYMRLRQQLGIAHAFRNSQYSRSWNGA